MLLFFLFLLAICNLGDAQAEVSIAIAGDKKYVYRSADNSCGIEYIPDSPIRAFKRADGKFVVISGTYDNWIMTGDNFDSLLVSCDSVLGRSQYGKEVKGKLWIQALYTVDGENLFGVASNDIWEETKSEGCVVGPNPGRCWLNQLRVVSSSDGGRSFRHSGLLASLGDRYPSDEKMPFGFFSVSNIVGHLGHLYMIAYVRGGDRQPFGNCLLRSKGTSPDSGWLAWSGVDFTVDLIDSQRACAPVFPDRSSAVRSISYVTSKQVFVALLHSRPLKGQPAAPVPGVYVSTSKDLKSWTKPELVISLPIAPRTDSREDIFAYPSLIDPESKSLNFDTIDQPHVRLFVTVHHLKNGQGTMNRSILYFPVTVD